LPGLAWPPSPQGTWPLRATPPAACSTAIGFIGGRPSRRPTGERPAPGSSRGSPPLCVAHPLGVGDFVGLALPLRIRWLWVRGQVSSPAHRGPWPGLVGPLRLRARALRLPLGDFVGSGLGIKDKALDAFQGGAYPGASPTLKHRAESAKDVKTPCF
jgi:hypothetical protein